MESGAEAYTPPDSSRPFDMASRPLGAHEREGRGPPTPLILVILVMLAIRLIAANQIHLTEDEAYYRLWSMAPAFGYFDHPPMIAWWIWLGRRLGGDDALGVRLLPILASAATSLLVFDMARLAGASRRIAGRAGIWFNAMWLVAAGGFLAVPDAPNSFFWALALWASLRAMRAGAIGWWMAAGAAAGLAALSKYSALFLAPGMVIWLAWTPKGRAALRTPGPWIAALIAVALFGINIGWNADHRWLTFHKQFGRVAGARFAPRYLAEFIGGQFLLLNPLIALFIGAAAAVRAKAGTRAIDLAPFLATCAPLVAYLVVHSLHDRVEAHWPAPIYPALAIVAAAGAEHLKGWKGWRRAAAAVPILGAAIIVAALAWLAVPGAANVRADPATPVRGWPAFAGRLEGLRTDNGAAWVGTTSYGLDAELSTEPALAAPIFQITERDRWRDLAQPPPDLSRPGLVIDLTRRLNPAALDRCFEQVRPLGVITRDAGAVAYAVYLVSGPRRAVLAEGC